VLSPTTAEQAATAQIAEVLQQLNQMIAQEKQNAGFEASKLFANLQIDLPVHNLYFVEIAKFRALRLLLTQLAWQHGVADFMPSQVHIHAKTTHKAQEKPDENYYLISNTTQAMSAVLGGCNLLSITPHTQQPQEFGERIARNVANLLREESYLDKVAAIGNGAYYIMHLTDKIAEKAWELLGAKH
jgi:methylmalonyl-CoA mutase